MVSIKAALVTLSLLTTTLAMVPATLDHKPVKTCIECIPSPNNCDITAPCSKVLGQKLLCACRAGYRSASDPTDISKQWRLEIPNNERRVWVAPGVVCDKLCDHPFAVDACKEVPVIHKCVVYPPPFVVQYK